MIEKALKRYYPEGSYFKENDDSYVVWINSNDVKLNLNKLLAFNKSKNTDSWFICREHNGYSIGLYKSENTISPFQEFNLKLQLFTVIATLLSSSSDIVNLRTLEGEGEEEEECLERTD